MIKKKESVLKTKGGRFIRSEVLGVMRGKVGAAIHKHKPTLKLLLAVLLEPSSFSRRQHEFQALSRSYSSSTLAALFQVLPHADIFKLSYS
ncbi:hypothetical protein Ahy_B03g064111 isoform C [Arachis hypogaea]|uniref:Uncharacterized protein n=1 Tax=Arachis hypogaea TaxID=3818 RepID=A0A444ZZ54_ARAHY|nr:hypothetical protein Ahy_B03g064111 isoform A [Arachis hypogaea]RYR19352.1 hypothetical protein Ahy_B03g064111 isoform C [Arachis hypogaea]